MKFWLSGEIMADVADAYRSARQQVERQLNEVFQTTECEGVDRIVFVAILRPAGDTEYPEFVKYHKRDKDFEARLRLDYEQFLRANSEEREDMVLDAVARAISRGEELGMKGFNAGALLSRLEDT